MSCEEVRKSPALRRWNQDCLTAGADASGSALRSAADAKPLGRAGVANSLFSPAGRSGSARRMRGRRFSRDSGADSDSFSAEATSSGAPPSVGLPTSPLQGGEWRRRFRLEVRYAGIPVCQRLGLFVIYVGDMDRFPVPAYARRQTLRPFRRRYPLPFGSGRPASHSVRSMASSLVRSTSWISAGHRRWAHPPLPCAGHLPLKRGEWLSGGLRLHNLGRFGRLVVLLAEGEDFLDETERHFSSVWFRPRARRSCQISDACRHDRKSRPRQRFREPCPAS